MLREGLKQFRDNGVTVFLQAFVRSHTEKGKAPPQRGFLNMGSMECLAVVSVVVPVVDDHLSANFPAGEVH